MENVDLSALQKLVQESIQRANLAILGSDTLAKSVPPRLRALEGRMNALEQRISSVEDSQHEIIRLLAGQDAANQRIEATLSQIASSYLRPALRGTLGAVESRLLSATGLACIPQAFAR